ncbi:WD repeat-containing protein 13-like [Limulus polyphemus]|uniref:WD repeat-containing protein 13-like n=1 Tax=Limulus polyphemus TaxID=6850 RepID=A0ABM1C1A6_LIMPO|nr:WD repeat-containing protein 13-like [Limulus polyphemus]
MTAVWQQVLALDARYNNYRAPNNPNFRTQYIRRRSQLLRENAKEEHNPFIRKQYLRIRSQLLAQRYGVTIDQTSIRSRSLGARSSSRATLEKPESLDGRGEVRKGLHKLPDHVTEEGLVPTYAAEASK